MVRGEAVNVSHNGACVLAERFLEPSSVLPCRFHFPGVPVAVPVLMQVRWVEPVLSRDGMFRLGLNFII